MSSLLEVFGSRRRSSRDIPAGATIYDLDLHALSSKDLKQQRIDTMVQKIRRKICGELLDHDFISAIFQQMQQPIFTIDLPFQL